MKTTTVVKMSGLKELSDFEILMNYLIYTQEKEPGLSKPKKTVKILKSTGIIEILVGIILCMSCYKFIYFLGEVSNRYALVKDRHEILQKIKNQNLKLA